MKKEMLEKLKKAVEHNEPIHLNWIAFRTPKQINEVKEFLAKHGYVSNDPGMPQEVWEKGGW